MGNSGLFTPATSPWFDQPSEVASAVTAIEESSDPSFDLQLLGIEFEAPTGGSMQPLTAGEVAVGGPQSAGALGRDGFGSTAPAVSVTRRDQTVSRTVVTGQAAATARGGRTETPPDQGGGSALSPPAQVSKRPWGLVDR